MKNILVTGCAGFVGQRVSEILLERGYSVIGIDNLNDYYSVEIKKHRIDILRNYTAFRFYPDDIEDVNMIEAIFRMNHIDCVIHLAARAGVPYSISNPYIYMTTNVIGTLNVLECMREHGVKKIVMASTSSLYAGNPLPFSEDMPVNTPISPYAASKKAAESIAYTYHHLYNIDVAIVRYFTVYGPCGRPDMSIFKFIEAIYRGRSLTLTGEGKQGRDFTYIDDIALGTISALSVKGHEIINLGGGVSPVNMMHVIGRISTIVGQEPRINHIPMENTDIQDTMADISKAKSILGWSPCVPFDIGIDKTVSWHLRNRNLLDNIDI